MHCWEAGHNMKCSWEDCHVAHSLQHGRVPCPTGSAEGLHWRQLPSGKSGLPSCKSRPSPSLPQGRLSFLRWGQSPCPPHSSLPTPPRPPPRPQKQLLMNLFLQAYPHPQVPFLGKDETRMIPKWDDPIFVLKYTHTYTLRKMQGKTH